MRLLILAITAICLHSPASASVLELLERSGTLHMLHLLPEQFEEGFVQGLEQSGLSEQVVSGTKELVEGSFDKNALITDLESELERGLSKDDLEVLMAWYKTPLATRITDLENQANSTAHLERIAASMDSLLMNQPRLVLATRIERALDATNQTMQMARNVQSAIVKGMLGDLEPVKKEALIAEFETAMEATRPEMNNYILASIIGSYEALDDEELVIYTEFLEQPATRKFYEVTQRQLADELSNMAKRLGSRLKEYFEAFAHKGANQPAG
jgi:uncharacterized protein DUF2059